MNTKRKTLWIAIASASLCAATAAAQDDFGFEDESAAEKPVYESYIELGAGFTDDGNGKFGEYTSGLMDQYQKDSGFVVGKFKVGGADPETASEWSMQGNTEAGRLFSASFGVQGDFGIKMYADQVEKVEYGDAHSVFERSSNVLLLPEGWIQGSATGSSARDLSNYNEVDVGYKRQSFGIEGLKRVSDLWAFSANYQVQEKDGSDLISGNQGFYGSTQLLEPIDHTIQNMSFRADYADMKLQTGFEIHFSEFNNANAGLKYENATYTSAASHALDLEQLALEPDNDFVRFSIDGGYLFNDYTRLGWFADWSRAEQDQSFLPVVLDEHYYTGVEAFPYSSLDGEVERQSLRLVLTGRPLSRFDYRMTLDYKDRDTKHDPLPVQSVSYRGSVSSEYISTHVYDKESLEFKLEGGYRFANRMRLRGGWAYEEIDRDAQEVDESYKDSTDENRFWAELKMPQMGALSVRLRGQYSQLDNDISHQRDEHVHNEEGIAERALPFFLLARDQDRYSISADYMANSQLSFNASYEYIQDDFDNDAYGLEERESQVLNLAASFSPSEALAFTVYGSHEEYQLEQLSLYTQGSSAPPSAEWSLEQEDEADTLGFSAQWSAIPDKLDVVFDYSWMKADSAYASIAGTLDGAVRECSGAPSYSGFCTGSMPDVSNKLQRLNLKLDYHYNEQTDISARYVYEHRRMDDWSWGASRAYAAALGFYWQDPSYDSHAVVVAVRYKF